MNRLRKNSYCNIGIYTCVSILLFLYSPTYAQVTLPYGESFESGFGDWSNVGGDDIDWTRQTGGTPSNFTGPSGAHDGSYYLFTESSNPNFNSDAYLDASFNFTGISNPVFSFRYHMYGSDMGTLSVEVDGNQEFSVTGQQHTSNDDGWTEQEVDLSAYSGQTVTIRFIMSTGANYRSDAAIDYIRCFDNCSVNAGTASITDATLCATGSTTLNLTGQDGGTSIQWQSSTDNVSFSDISGATAASSSSGTLTAGNTYYFRAEVTNGCTSYSDTVSILVNNGNGSLSPPYTEGFESGIGSWTQSTSDDINWTRQNGETPSTNTGPTGASAGSYYLFTESSNPNFNSEAILEASFDFTGITTPQIEFDYHMYGDDMGTLSVLVNGTSVWSRTGQQHANGAAAWTTATIDLSAYGGYCYALIQIRMETGANFNSDAAIDNISVTEVCSVNPGSATVSSAALCAAGTVNLTLSGHDAGTTIQWQSSTDNVSFSNISGATTANETSGTLSTGNTYYFRAAVTNSCTSYTPSVSVVVNNGNGPNSLPSSEDLETNFGIWSQSTSDDIDWTRQSGGTPSANTGPSAASSGSFYGFTEASGASSNSSAILEAAFDFTGLSGAHLQFDYHMYGADMGTLRIKANGTIVWSRSGQQHISETATWTTAVVDLGNYVGDCYVLIQIEGLTGPSFTSDVAIDNISITEPCPVDAGNTSISSGALCAAGTVNLALTGQDAGTTIQWQESINGGAFSDISGATSANHTTGTLSTGNTYMYRAGVTNSCISYSDTSQVIVNAGNGTNTPPDFEGLEADFGIWTQSTADDINWTRQTGTTPSADTGPSGAATGTNYAFTESSNPNQNSEAILEATFNFTGFSTPTLSFSYHMYGAEMGSLRIDVNGLTVWSRSGQQHASSGTPWSNANVDLSAYANQCYVLIQIVGTTGTSFHSDMAIDNINIEEPCGVNPGDASISETGLCAAGTVNLSLTGEDAGTTLQWEESTDNVTFSAISGATSANHTTATLSTGNTYYYRCAVTNSCTEYSDTVAVIVNSGNGTNTVPQSEDYETGLGIWTQSASDDFDWTRQTGGTPSGNTGPSGASSGSYYLFTESSPPNTNSTATIQADFNFSAVTNPSISFDYHMYGDAMGTLSLVVNGTTVWSRTGQQHASSGASWTTASVDLSAFGGACYALVQFVAETGSTLNSDMAIDNVSFVAPTYTWTGTTSTDWTIGSNWSGGLAPSNVSNIIIPDVSGASGNNPIIGSVSTGQAHDVTIQTGGQLTINNGGNLQVSGDFSTADDMVLGDGLVSFVGTSSQSTTGNITFEDITINNGNGVSFSSGNINVSGTLLLTSGNLATNNALTITSNATETGSIGEVTGGSLTGNVTIQRYWNRAANGYVHICSPINSQTLQEWNDDIVTTGFTGSDYPSQSFNSIYTYDETQPGDLDQGWVEATNITNTIPVGTGVLAYVLSGATTLDVTGSIHTGDYNFGVSYNDDAGQPATEDGWNLVGNPYASAIDWEASGWTKTNVNDALYIWDDVNQQYASYVSGVGSNGGSRYIASSQSFWVQTHSASPELIIKESCKSNNDPTFFRTTVPTLLRMEVEGSNGFKDETIVRIDSSASFSFDKNADALKLYSWNGSVPNMSTIGEYSSEFSINTFKKEESGHEIPLKITVGVTGSYTLTFNQNTLNENDVFLEDKETETIVDINVSSDYTFNMNSSNTSTRFVLYIGKKPPQVLPIELLSFDAFADEEKVDLKWTTASETHNNFFTVERSNDGINFEKLISVKGAGNSSGLVEYFESDFHPLQGISYYRLKQTDFNGQFSYSKTIPVDFGKKFNPEVVENISVWPNPNSGDLINIEINGYNSEREVLVVIQDIAGKEYYSKVFLSDINGQVLNAIEPANKLPAGHYLIIGSDKHHLHGKKLIVK